MSPLPFSRSTAALVAVVGTLLVLFVWVALRSGPLTPVPVTVTEVVSRAIAPALFGLVVVLFSLISHGTRRSGRHEGQIKADQAARERA